MSKQRHSVKQTNVRHKDGIGAQVEQSVEIDDNLLPSAKEIAEYKVLDPGIVSWLKDRAEKEQEFRHKYMFERLGGVKKHDWGIRVINICGLIFAFIIMLAGLGLSAFLIYNGQNAAGTIFGGGTLLIAVRMFIMPSAKKAKKTTAVQNTQGSTT